MKQKRLNKLYATGVFFSFIGLVLIIGLFLKKSNIFDKNPQAVPLTIKQDQIPHMRQVISSASGGKFEVNNIGVDLPAGFTNQDVVISYSQVTGNKVLANHQVGAMFDLRAKKLNTSTVPGQVNPENYISEFNKDLTISVSLDEDLLAKVNLNKLSLYYFDTEAQRWEKVDSEFNSDAGQLLASVDHFTLFVLAAGDPNAGVNQPAENFIVDDQDGPPAFVQDGQTDADQPSFWRSVGSGNGGDAQWTGNSINNTPHNWATWSIFEGLTGGVEVKVTIPDLQGKNLTVGANYLVTHAAGQTTITVDQEANRGKTVSLGTFTFDGSGSVYLDDVVPEQSTNFASHLVFDTVSFGGELGQTDFTPPLIEDVRSFTDNGNFRISAKVTDEESGVADVYLLFNTTAYPMSAMGDDRYALDLPYQANMDIDYFIVAYDVAGNEGVWSPKFGYITRGAFYNLTGYYPGMVRVLGSECNTNPACATGLNKRQQIVGHPVNTVNGNLIEEVELLKVGGRPEIDLDLTYNNQAGRPSIFGENWTHSYNYHAVEIKTPESNAVHVQYPDGQVVSFTGGDLTPPEGYFEKLERDDDGFILTFKDLSQAYFDADGDISRYEDANDNGLNFSYGEKLPHTLMSELTSITADAGRSVSFSYNSEGLVESISAPENKILQFTYSEDKDLATWTDANGGSTAYSYENHNLLTSTTPEGYVYMENSYDGERRVVDHKVGKAFSNHLDYNGDTTVVTDANAKANTYQFENDLLTSISDDIGAAVQYEFNDQKQIKKITDEEGNSTEYQYNEHGNKILEKDALGFEVTWQYDLSFNKPTQMLNKLDDHVTAWEYDAKGNLLEEVQATGESRIMNYDEFGQLLSSADFNGNETTYSYTEFGDLSSFTKASGDITQYEYDGLGRQVALTNPRQFTYSYSYDGNDNLTDINGPLGYHLGYEYDANNRLLLETDANSGKIKYEYDKSNNLISQKNQLDFETVHEYGLMNELKKETSPEGRVSEYQYDDGYNLVAVAEGVGTDDLRITNYEYSLDHDLLAVTDAEGRVTKFEYDPLGRLLKETRNSILGLATAEQNVETKYEYSPTGALVKVLDPNNNATEYEVDVLDRLVMVTDAENQETKYEYDAQGNTIKVTNPRSFEMRHEYDKVNRLAKTIDAKNGETILDYDENSNLIKQTDANQISTAYSYDALDRRIEKLANAVAGVAADSQSNVSTKYGYDLHGNLTSLTNPRNYTTNFVFDAAHRNTDMIDAYDHVAKLIYDKENNLLESIDRNSHANKYSYDILNRLVQATNPEQHSDSFSYDKVDNLLEFNNKRGKIFSKEYDPLNRVKVATDPYGNTKQFEYDAVGNLLKLTDENNHADSFSYDKVYRLTGFTDAEGNFTQRDYDPNSNLLKLTDAEGNPTEYAYDELDRLIAKTNAEDETEEYAYDATVNMTLKTEADDTDHEFTYDPLYRLAQVVNNFKDAEESNNDTNVKTSYEYDSNGNLITQIDANDHKTRFEYDRLDRLGKEINPLDKNWQYSYDHEFNLTERVDANEAKTAYQYYADDELKVIDYPEYDVKYNYSETNFPITMEDNLGITSWGYDDLDRLISQNDAFSRDLAYEYDPVGNLTKLSYPDGRNMAHSYLKNDWLKNSVSSDSDGVDYSRNKVGFTTNLDRSNNTWSKANYDKVYRSLEVHDNQVGSGDHLVSKFNYTYNDVGHITKEIAEYGWRQGDVIETDYEYDGLHRLARVTGDPTTAGEADQDSRYEYDSVGNRLEMIEQLKQGDEVRKYDYNPANQLTQINIDSPMYPNLLTTDYSYDNNGNRIDRLVLDESGEDRGVAYSYDTENRLLVAQDYQRQIVQKSNPGQDKKNPEPEVLDPVEGLDVVAGMGSIEGDPVDPIPTVETNNGSVKELIHLAHTDYEYDGNGRRLVATYSPGSSGDPSIGSGQGLKRTEYTFDKLDPVAEYDMLNGQRNNLYRSSAQDLLFYQEFPSSHEASEGQASEQAPNGTKYFYHHDGEGNIAATTKHQGQSDHSYRYDEYGFILPENGNPASNSNEGSNGWIYPHNAYSLSQKQYDGHTNLYYFGSRFYDPEVGVWINQDSYRGTISDPRTLNRYLYNASSPINYVDWYGFDFIVIDRSKAKMYVYDKKNGTLMEEWNVKVGPNTEKGTYELYEWDPYSVDVPGEAIGGSGLIVGTDKPWAKRDKKGFMITDENGVPVVENANNPFGAYAGIMRDSDTGDRIPMQIHGRRGDLTTDPWNCGSDEYSCKYTGQGCIALSNENVINFAENMSWGKDGRKVNTVEIIGEIPTRDEYNAANQPVSSPQPSGGVVSRSWNRLVNWVKSWF